jgi:Xaa-Pro aminopeptidase
MKYCILFLAIVLSSCSNNNQTDDNPFSGHSPWPEIRIERINTLLPEAMERSGVDVWAVVCRENNNDPLALHIGCENAGGTAVFLFNRIETGIHSIAFSPVGEATALRDVAMHDSVAIVARGESAITMAGDHLRRTNPSVIALNYSSSNALADGLSHTQYQAMISALGPQLANMITSSEVLVYEWLSVKLPAEIEILRTAAELTAAREVEAYKQVIPGESTDADIARFLKSKMAEFGVGDAWAPEQNPNVNSGADRGHSHSTDKVIMPGDVIQIDFGIRVYDTWVTDIQRFAYVLHPDEIEAPEHIQHYWEVAREGVQIAARAMVPGATGYEVDKAQREWMRANGSLPVIWSTGHPVGYVAHDIGPALGGAQEGRTPWPSALKPIRVGNVFAFDGFYSWEIEGGTKTISVEEMVHITENGAEFLVPPQKDLILIPTNR